MSRSFYNKSFDPMSTVAVIVYRAKLNIQRIKLLRVCLKPMVIYLVGGTKPRKFPMHLPNHMDGGVGVQGGL